MFRMKDFFGIDKDMVDFLAEKNYQENKKTLYRFFNYGYTPKDVARFVGLPQQIIENYYKEFMDFQKELDKMYKNRKLQT